ncbi:ferric-chelate reductase [Cryptococcus gattii EJB2]|uniref:Ferric-chelate reductase n=1 Tax=Cryptococcus gattii EJB2 TaxID=1296103 RepID=A0ABR5BPA1_9TREE|nr:ferric-chelate reductase [Cryptococcus gattii EJB2]
MPFPSHLSSLVWVGLLALPAVLSSDVVEIKPLITECAGGALDAIGLISFSDYPEGSAYYTAYCASQYWKTSLAITVKTYCSGEEITKGWALLQGYCEDYGLLTLEDIDVLVAKVDMSIVPTVDVFRTEGEVYNNTILVDRYSWTMGAKTERVWDREMIFHHAFGWTMYLLLGCAIFVGVLNRLVNMYRTHLIVNAGRAMDRSEIPPSNYFFENLSLYYQKYLGTPALFGQKHVHSFYWFCIPTRLESLLVFIYVAFNIIFSFVGYNLFRENLYWPGSYSLQVARYIADRTAIMSFYNLPILWCLAGRNDVILWITGWSFSSMNIFHRWIAIVTAFQGIAHSAAWTWIERDVIAVMFQEMYWRAGVFAAITMSLMLPFSIKPVREKWYEFFLIAHIFLALATLILLFYHVTVYGTDYNGWLWGCVAVWVFDRVIRIIRLQVLSFKAAAGNNAVMIATGGENGLIRLSVTCSIRHIPKPGQHYYLYTPMSITPWENHPFTIGSWEVNKSSTTLHFLIGTKDGATRRMRKMVNKATNGQADLRVLVEGPYGHASPVHRFDNILFIAGGSGITAALPYLHDLVSRLSVDRCVTKKVTLVWVVKNPDYAADVLSKELSSLESFKGLKIDIQIHVTSNTGAITPRIEEAEGHALAYNDPSPLTSPTIEKSLPSSSSKTSLKETLLTGRPEMRAVLQASISKLVGSETLAVLACGPGNMMDDMRAAVVDAYGIGEGKASTSRLEYFEESFSW